MTRFTVAFALALTSLFAVGCADYEYIESEGYSEDFELVPEGAEVVNLVICGDGELEEGEECDDGEGNADANACTATCMINVCGDGLLYEDAEQCDEGENNGNGFCTAECTLAQ
jgi:hypothetical protein